MNRWPKALTIVPLEEKVSRCSLVAFLACFLIACGNDVSDPAGVRDDASVRCGPGTHQIGGVCLADELPDAGASEQRRDATPAAVLPSNPDLAISADADHEEAGHLADAEMLADASLEAGAGDASEADAEQWVSARRYPGPCLAERHGRGVVLENEEYEYDDRENLLRIQFFGEGRQPRYFLAFTYDAMGRLLTRTYSDFPRWTVVTTYTYDIEGRLLSAEESGSQESLTTFTYDESGNMARRETDDDIDGDTDTAAAYTYDDDGNMTTKGIDFFADGSIDEHTTYSWGDNNRLAMEELAGGAERPDGSEATVIVRTTYIYDANGSLARTDIDGDRGHSVADGVVDEHIVYTYDGHGNLIRDVADNGSRIKEWTYAYTCWEGDEATE